MTVYHRSKHDFTELDKDELCGGVLGKGFYFSTSKLVNRKFGKFMYEATIDSSVKLLIVNRLWISQCKTIVLIAKANGYDGVRFGRTVMLFDEIDIRKIDG